MASVILATMLGYGFWLFWAWILASARVHLHDDYDFSL